MSVNILSLAARSLKALVPVALIGAAAMTASAATLTFSNAIPLQLTDFNTHTPPASPLALSQFNSNLGTLVSVSITVVEDFSVSGSLHNNATNTVSADFQAFVSLTATDPNGDTATSVGGANLPDVHYNAIAPGATVAYGPFGTDANPAKGTAVTLGPGNFAPYIGTGTFNINAFTQSSETVLGGGGNITAPLMTKAGFIATVTYTYNPMTDCAAPEPTTMALVGSALIGLGVFGRKRLVR